MIQDFADHSRRTARRRHALAAIVLLVLAPSAAAGDRNERVKEIFGWIEWVAVGDKGIRLKAKLDTGATTSSITAENIEYFTRDGAKWVRFAIRDEHLDGIEIVEAPLARHVRIRRHGGQSQRRPVVKLGLCVGDIYRERQFSLIDRSGFNYPVLVGRNYLRDHILVDSDIIYTREPACENVREQAERASALDPEPDVDDLEEE
ncbi:ATP-dependent zinc protease family protein [Sinimarinibacterium thermocellulolyticum]|uniref:ATP-dependent zinc protease n=1 Tax=Sinimarinibacterium thermocellulolyticum TaxID=3170016 RepID=A0ABV2A703_9GAMM